MNQIMYGQPKTSGKCDVCKTTETRQHHGTGKRKKVLYKTPFYTPVFLKVSWFRGDDVKIGTMCNDCIKSQARDKKHALVALREELAK